MTVVTGFLGAGKSTLVERWLAEQGEETAVIVNEWGEIGIDGALLSGRRSRLIEITGGCLCCTSQAEMARALASLAAARPAPARVLVETSGAASPAGVVRALTRGESRERLRLDGVATVVDGARLDRVLAFDLAIEQLGFADIVVVSHADEAIALEAVTARLTRYAPGAVMAFAERGVVRQPGRAGLSLSELLEQRDEVLHFPSTSSPAHEAIDSVALCHDGALDEGRFVEWVASGLSEVEARILRIKGIVAVSGVDARVILQGVGEAIEVSVGTPWADSPRQSRIVILGLGLDAPVLEQGFAACAAR